jgi:hypothetical protein
LNRFAAARLVLIFGMVSLLEQKLSIILNDSIEREPDFKNRWRERTHAFTPTVEAALFTFVRAMA